MAKAVVSLVSDPTNKIGDWTFAKHARTRSPLFLEMTFVVDEKSEMPKLVGVDPTPVISSSHKKYVSSSFEENENSVNEEYAYAHPIAASVCDAAWKLAFDTLEDDLLERRDSKDSSIIICESVKLL